MRPVRPREIERLFEQQIEIDLLASRTRRPAEEGPDVERYGHLAKWLGPDRNLIAR